MKLAIGSDHGGYTLKDPLVAFIRQLGHEVVDFGTYSADLPVDYPDFAFLVAAGVSEGRFQAGIVLDGAGIGSAMVCNKVPGVRAALCHDLYAARNAREHNNANVLTLGSRVIGVGLAQEIVKIFLTTEFATRHQARIDKITRIERELLRR